MTHPAIQHDLDPAAYDFAWSKTYCTPEEDAFKAWYALFLDQGDNANNFQLEGDDALSTSDVQFAQDYIESIHSDLPDVLVIDWEKTAAAMLVDYRVIELPDGRRAYFLR